MAAKIPRYLGVQPFKTSDQHIFFGREADVENLHDFIMLEKLVVLFGKSGYGKSSLLSAGIAPKLTDEGQPAAFRFKPVEMNMKMYVEGASFSPFETLKLLLKEAPVSPEADFLKNISEEESLWLFFKQRQAASNGQFVMIFDQFENFFSYPPDQQAFFRRQVAEALYADIPQSARAGLDSLSDERRRFVTKPMNVKAVFAIRSDRMSFLDSMKDVLPAILHKRYELRPLDVQQAREAITRPAAVVDDDFKTQPFEYTEAALSAIIGALTTSEAKDATASGVEAFLIQIVCEEIEKSVEQSEIRDRNGNGLPDVDVENLPNFKNLYENYYRRKLGELAPSVQPSAQMVLEDGLLSEDASTQEGRRISVDVLALLDKFRPMGLTANVLADLEKTYLVRREVNTVGGFSLEISHDTLIAPIQKARAERRAIEEAQRVERERLEKERQLEEANKQAALEKRRTQSARALAFAALIGLVFAAWQYFIAKKALAQAQAANTRVVVSILKDVDSVHIVKLEYEAALEKCQTALELKVDAQKPEINKRLLEIAYFFTESDTLSAAIKALNFIEPYHFSAIAPDARQHLLTEIRRLCPPDYFDSLEKRYYPTMINVAGGAFTMGSNKNPDAMPQHIVNVKSFKMAETETTVWQYSLFLKAKGKQPYKTPDWGFEGNNPMVFVNWEDAGEYFAWLNERRGGAKYRLPTEAEWEFAARGGNPGKDQPFEYSGSNKIDEVAWYYKNSRSRTQPVKRLKPNQLGLFDMSGNVWEWCEDIWHDNYKNAPLDGGAWLSGGVESSRVCRGGSLIVIVRSLSATTVILRVGAVNVGFRVFRGD